MFISFPCLNQELLGALGVESQRAPIMALSIDFIYQYTVCIVILWTFWRINWETADKLKTTLKQSLWQSTNLYCLYHHIPQEPNNMMNNYNYHNVCNLTFIDKKLGQQRRQPNSMSGVRIDPLYGPLETVHLWVPLDSIEGISFTWYKETYCCDYNSGTEQWLSLLNDLKSNLVTFYGWDKVDFVQGDICRQQREETVQLLVFLEGLKGVITLSYYLPFIVISMLRIVITFYFFRLHNDWKHLFFCFVFILWLLNEVQIHVD